jgi:hypothetical protein
MRPFDQELTLCKRYWESTYDYGTLPGTSTDAGVWNAQADSASAMKTLFAFSVQKRLTPTVTLYTGNVSGGAQTGKWTAPGASVTGAASAQAIGAKGWQYILSSGLTTGIWYYGHYVADARLQ